jgi:hypothetical protein
MTLPASGALSFSQIQTEFTGSNPIAMTEYYGRGGLPASGVIKVSDFYGKSNGIPIGLTAGLNAGGGSFTNYTGYGDGTYGVGAFGTLTSGLGALPSGVVIEEIAIITPTATPTTRLHELRLKGFGATDPTINYVKSVEIGGVIKLTSAASYQFFSASGRAIWSWPNQASPFWTLTNGAAATANIAF